MVYARSHGNKAPKQKVQRLKTNGWRAGTYEHARPVLPAVGKKSFKIGRRNLSRSVFFFSRLTTMYYYLLNLHIYIEIT